MFGLKKLKTIIFGKPRNPMQKETRGHITLIAFLAWIGLGADGLSSSSYGPQEAFLALGTHTHLALYLSVMIAVTVFIIAMAYNQVIELFPSGGGGYKVASRLIGKFPGLISGTSLILGYILTITMSIASGVDQLFSLLPLSAQAYKLVTEAVVIVLLMYLNLRGMKESISVFLPIFLGFIITHIFIIVYGVAVHGYQLPIMFQNTIQETAKVSSVFGWFFIISLLLKSYSLGGGTYTGLEAVSNNVNSLAEPRVKTGKLTMLYMAVSLSFTAGGILLLYLLWNVQPQAGQTLNAIAFSNVMHNFPLKDLWLTIILATEAGLLFIGANTGFLGGPAVLANMAVDSWVPKKFRNLSNRLVVQNGIVLFGVCALLVLLGTHGSISKLIILYSTSVFITFSMSLLGLTIFWAKKDGRRQSNNWFWKLLLSLVGLIVCFFILITIIITKFAIGGWTTILINGGLITVCILISIHYKNIKKQIKKLDQTFTFSVTPTQVTQKISYTESTAIFFIGESIGEGMHTILWAQRMFPNYFKNFVFVSVGIVDVNSFESDAALHKMQRKVAHRLKYFTDYAHQHGIPTKVFCDYGTDHVEKLLSLSLKIQKEFKNPIFFAARVVLKNENWLTRQLHNETPVALQRNLHMHGMQMIILPVMLGKDDHI